MAILVRRRVESDDAYILALSEASFDTFSRRASGVVRGAMQEAGSATLVAMVGEEWAGFCVLELNRHGKNYGPLVQPTIARLAAIAVDGRFRKRGVGRALIEGAHGVAADAGALSVFLTTAVRNHAARALFHRTGYRPLLTWHHTYRRREPALELVHVIAPAAV